MDRRRAAPSDLGVARKRILVVDADRHLQTIVRTNLEAARYAVEIAGSGPQALEILDRSEIDLVISEVVLPGMDGYELARRIRALRLNNRVPIVMLTAKAEVDDKLEAFEAGADDFIAKPFVPGELIARVGAAIRRVDEGGKLSPLTRLPGNLSIETELRRRVGANEPFAVLYLDLDNFKAFNDVYGFARGDEAIRLLARTCVDVIRRRGTDRDFVGHIGGDDFLIVTMPNRSGEVAREIIDGFELGVPALYSAADLERGYIETRDRRGAIDRFPITSLSVAGVSNDQRALTDYAEVVQIVAELKRYAKSIGGSVYVKDQRRK